MALWRRVECAVHPSLVVDSRTCHGCLLATHLPGADTGFVASPRLFVYSRRHDPTRRSRIGAGIRRLLSIALPSLGVHHPPFHHFLLPFHCATMLLNAYPLTWKTSSRQ